MDDMDVVVGIVAAALATLVGVLLLIICYRALRWIFKLAARAVHRPLAGTPSWLIGLAAVVAFFAVPPVFHWLVSIVRDIVLILAYDLPSAVFESASNFYLECIRADVAYDTEVEHRQCDVAVVQPIWFFWTSTFSGFLTRYWPSPEFTWDILRALAIFTALIVVGLGAIRFAPATKAWLDRHDGVSIGRGIPLALAFLFALYLVFTAIVATPFFEQTAGDLQAARDRLETRITETAMVMPAYKKSGPVVENEETIKKIKQRGEAIRRNLQALSASYALTDVVEGLEREVQFYSRHAEKLENAEVEFPPIAESYQDLLIAQFERANRGRLGARQTDEHVDAIATHYRVWLSQSMTSARECAAEIERQSEYLGLRLAVAQVHLTTIEGQQQSGEDEISALQQVYLMQSGRPSFGNFDDIARSEFDRSGGRTAVETSAALSRLCSIGSATSVSMPSRKSIEDSLGIFGLTTGWLLRTESRNLALITGMIGFGLFGALGASFIRGSSVDERGRPRIPSNPELIGVFIRGISAAILTYLVVVGGLAVFTKTELEPNAYAVFFACFVAAVFSEDVWDWARRRQQSRFEKDNTANANPGEPAPDPQQNS